MISLHAGTEYFDWAHFTYDGAPDSPTRHLCGHGDTIEACKAQIDDMVEEFPHD